MHITVWIPDPRYVEGRTVPIEAFTVEDAQHLCNVWDGNIEIAFAS